MGERVLEADCASCAGLCCVVPAFVKSSDFAITKPAGKACPNLGGDFRCGIHEKLDQKGFHGCVVFDCFGAGQRITQETPGADLSIVRQLHELMWLLTEALKLDAAQPVHQKLRDALAEIDHLAGAKPAAAQAEAQRQRVNPLLLKASHLARAGTRRPDHRGANLIGRKMRGADLRGASLRGALLIGADLREADLRKADFTGADLRGADLRGANIKHALFLTASQLRAAVTDP
jgi:hypothetical protein